MSGQVANAAQQPSVSGNDLQQVCLCAGWLPHIEANRRRNLTDWFGPCRA